MIFVDTGAWFALAVRNDPDHPAAIKWLAQNREPLITTDYVLAETATLIRMRDKTPAVIAWRSGARHRFSNRKHLRFIG